MFFISIGNYTVNFNKKFLEFNFLIIKKEKLLKNLKVKKNKNFFLLNIKQIIYLFLFYNKWKKIFFKNIIFIIINLNFPIKNSIEGFLKLIILSKGLIKLNFINLEKIFLNLKNIIWGNFGFIEYNDFIKLKKKILNNNFLIIESIDKIPYLTKYILPKNIRISNTNRVRLGSYLSNGVTIMSEGYVNFNTFIGLNCMIEGRISAGVKIGNFTDIGGSASIMGTLSGGGSNIVSIGNNCLLGANSGIGISIGNNCIVEAGLYITIGTKITFFIKNFIFIVKAKKLSFINNLLFYRNSINGKIECLKIKKKLIINFLLHNN